MSPNQVTTEASGPIVEAHALSKVYKSANGPNVAALQDAHFNIERGEFVAIVGPSGSGKSTLLNLLGALDTPTSGRLKIDGVSIAGLSSNGLADFRRNTVGLIFQLFNLVPVLSALDNVKLPLVPYPPKKFKLNERAQELLAEVGLANRAHHLPSQLSGGEQQRVAVARALINGPKLLLADEPTGNLDSRSGADLMQLFSKLHREQGMTVVMVTHDMAMAEYAQRLIELRDGKVVEPTAGAPRTRKAIRITSTATP
ncbi:MAG: ABC transporter ATP-binding protein [Chloroflexota bacterium]|nr:ABC transporter ATP-binding protein [Chloroflexota bacterium]MDQ5865854.1 ABC transporter ATP-binding protein [Chloroflexota bacterium]